MEPLSRHFNYSRFLGLLEGHSLHKDMGFLLSGFKKALLQNPRKKIRGRIFSEMIRIWVRKSELQAESRSYRPKVGDTAGQTPRIRTESPRQGPRMGFRCFYTYWPPAVESSIAVEDVVENRGPYRVLVSRLF